MSPSLPKYHHNALLDTAGYSAVPSILPTPRSLVLHRPSPFLESLQSASDTHAVPELVGVHATVYVCILASSGTFGHFSWADRVDKRGVFGVGGR